MAREFFKNLPNTTTPLSASRINGLLDGDEAMGNVVVDSIRGKNLLNLEQCTFEHCTLNNDKSVTSNISDFYFCSIKFTYLNDFILNNQGKNITFSIGQAISNKKVTIVIYGTRTGGSNLQEMDSSVDARYISGTIANDFTSITQIELRFNRSSTQFTDTTTIVSNLMLELNTTIPTNYALYQNLGNIPKIEYALMYAPYGLAMNNLTPWTQYDVDFNRSSDTVFITNNSDDFERDGNQIRCKFIGKILVLKYIYHDYQGELDMPDNLGTATNTLGKTNTTSTIIDVATGTNVDFKIVGGASNLTIYNARFIVIRLQ